MRIQLIHPPAFLNPTALTALRPSLPLGLAYIAGSLRSAGHEVSVLDAVGVAPDRVVRKGRVARSASKWTRASRASIRVARSSA
jgi:hypothetical protein